MPAPASTNKPPSTPMGSCGPFPDLVPPQQLDHNTLIAPEQPRGRATLLRCGLSHAEHGQWLELASLDCQDQRSNRKPTEDQERASTPATAIKKARGGCLRTASQLSNDRDRPKARDVACTEPMTDPNPARNKASTQAQWTSIRKRSVSTHVTLPRAGAEPGPSAWRNTFAQCLHET